jgi:hypothetical protein
MIVEPALFVRLSARRRIGTGTTMSNFNLRLLLTFSVLTIPGWARRIILEVPTVN